MGRQAAAGVGLARQSNFDRHKTWRYFYLKSYQPILYPLLPHNSIFTSSLPIHIINKWPFSIFSFFFLLSSAVDPMALWPAIAHLVGPTDDPLAQLVDGRPLLILCPSP